MAHLHLTRTPVAPRHDDYSPPWGCDSEQFLDELLLVGHVLSALHGPGYAYRGEERGELEEEVEEN